MFDLIHTLLHGFILFVVFVSFFELNFLTYDLWHCLLVIFCSRTNLYIFPIQSIFAIVLSITCVRALLCLYISAKSHYSIYRMMTMNLCNGNIESHLFCCLLYFLFVFVLFVHLKASANLLLAWTKPIALVSVLLLLLDESSMMFTFPNAYIHTQIVLFFSVMPWLSFLLSLSMYMQTLIEIWIVFDFKRKYFCPFLNGNRNRMLRMLNARKVILNWKENRDFRGKNMQCKKYHQKKVKRGVFKQSKFKILIKMLEIRKK